jgi:ubiquinone/menaquinone biosynthesis C-methylase UbiE
MSERQAPYYTAYEDRYQRVYASGVAYWTAFPEELAGIERHVRAFVMDSGLRAGARIVELGCGEGFVGEVLARMGMSYVGVDLALSALVRARRRLESFGPAARVVHGDITRLSWIADHTFDAAIDVQCLHMLIVEADRRRYLAEARRVLREGAAMLFCDESLSPEPTSDPGSYEQWVDTTRTNVVTPEPREAWHEGRTVTVHLPRVAARGKTVAQYRREMEQAGFAWILRSVLAEGAAVTFRVKRA